VKARKRNLTTKDAKTTKFKNTDIRSLRGEIEGANAMDNESNDEKLPEDLIDETLAESFPASDPPSWTLGREKRPPASGAESSSKREKVQTPTLERKDTEN
jgi:hypothetical protein